MTAIEDDWWLAQFQERMAELDRICTGAQQEMVRWRLWLFSCLVAALVLATGCFWFDVQDYPNVVLNIATSVLLLAVIGGGTAMFQHSQARERGRRAAAEMQALRISFGRD